MHKTIFKTMLAISKRYQMPLIAFLVLGISQTFVGLFALVQFQRLLDALPKAGQLADLTSPLVAYLGLMAINHVLIYLEGIPHSFLQHGPFYWVKLRALEKISRIDYLAYQELGTGNLVQMIENGAEATRNIFTGFYLSIAREMLPQLVISLIFIRFYDESLFAVIAVGYGVLYLAAQSLMIFWRKEVEKMLNHQENFSKFSVRAFMELVVFRINGRMKAEFGRVEGISNEIVRSRAKIYLLQELFFTGFAFLVFLVQAGVVVHQTQLILAGASTVGTLVALIAFINTVFGPISNFSMAYVQYQMEVVTFSRFHKFLSLPDDPGLSQGKQVQVTRGTIAFEDVSFTYAGTGQEDNRLILNNFSFIFTGGKTIALIGESGGGKSTLMRLVMYLLKPTKGKICVDEQDLAEAQLSSYYEAVAYIPQEPPVFDGTLRENLAFDRQPNPQQLNEVICQVGLEEWVDGLPSGLETLVGERGIKLSGGERQRLAFGRILLQNPKIVILDEPTSALDSLTENFITQNLKAFLQGKTVILVAHRLQTVTLADEIIVLEDGHILQQGKFEQLAAIPGRFKELWEQQANTPGAAQEGAEKTAAV